MFLRRILLKGLGGSNVHRGAHTGATVQHRPTSAEKRAKWLPLDKARWGPLGNTQVFRHPSETDDTPSTPASAVRARLAWGLRPHQRSRVSLCRTVRTAPSVQLIGRVSPDGQGRLVLKGVMTCASVHSCPCCAAAIMTARAKEITQALDNHRRDRTALVTLTLRHHAGIPLLVLRTLLGRAFSSLWSGKKGQELKRQLGLVGTIRSAEQTYGSNGWHPHLHALFFFDGAPPEGWEALITKRWLHVVRLTYNTMADTCRQAESTPDTPTFRAKVERVLGAKVSGGSDKSRRHLKTTLQDRAREFRHGLESMGGVEGVLPDERHGVRSEIVNSKDSAAMYLAKMGLEVSGMLTKDGKPGHYTHWQIARFAADGQTWAQALWQEHSKAMLGARQLTWSRGLRDFLGLEPERPDEVLASETEPELEDEDTPLAELDGPLWDLFAKQRRQLWVAELHDAYSDGTLAITLEGETRPARKPQEPAPVWWNRLQSDKRAHRKGADVFRDLSNQAEERDDRVKRYVSRAERELLREELRHHMICDLGIGAPF